MEADYVVTTYYVSAPGKQPITHAYGPYRKYDAVRLRKQFLTDTPVKPEAVFHVAVCRMLSA